MSTYVRSEKPAQRRIREFVYGLPNLLAIQTT